MKKRITHLMLLVIAIITSMGAFTSCKDYDEDNYNDLRNQLQNQNATINQLINSQITFLTGEIGRLEGIIGNINSCTCNPADVDNKISQALANYAQQHPDMTTDQVNTLIQQYIQQNPGMTTDQVNSLISQALAIYAQQHPDMTADQVTTLIQQYIQQNPGMSDTDVKNIVNTAIETSSTISGLQSSITSINNTIILAQNAVSNDSVRIDSLSQICNLLNTATAEAKGIAQAAMNKANLNDSVIQTLKSSINTLDSTIVAWTPLLNQVVSDASYAKIKADENAARINKLDSVYTELSQSIEDYASKEDVNRLRKSFDSLATQAKNYATTSQLQIVQDSANAMYAKAVAYASQITGQAVSDLTDTLNVKLGALSQAFNTASQNFSQQLTTLQNDLTNLTKTVENNTKAINQLTAVVYNVLNKYITSIIVQGTVNPVFGQVALPVNMRSNIVVAYYGGNEHVTYFPTVSTSDLVYEEYALTDKDAKMLGSIVDNEANKLPGGSVFISEEENNAGKIYLTVNPNTVDFTGTTFELENSIGEACGIKLGTLRPSTDKLTFGWSRAGVSENSKNAFYEAPAYLSAENIEKVKVNIDEGLKSSVKDLLANRGQGVNFSKLASEIYNQFDGILDANCVKGTWTDSLGTHSVYSQYALAATAVKPLSFAFLKDKQVGKLPTISPISEIDFSFDSLNINLKDLSFHIDSINVDIEIKFDSFTVNNNGDLFATVEIPSEFGQDPSDPSKIIVTATKIDTVNLDQVQEWSDKLITQMNTTIQQWGVSLTQEVKANLESQMNKMITQVNEQVNNMISSINGQLNSSVNDVFDKVSGMVTGNLNDYIAKMNTYLEKVNALTNKINNKLNNINSLLQVCMLYEDANGNFHQLSNSKAIPTVFEGTGAITLMPTSYTGELIAPAFKKFVAVTNVFKGEKSAQAGDAQCRATLTKTNKSEYMNKVLEGGRYAIAFEPARAGYTYEIVYSALDYAGKISTRKFYVTVK